VKPVILSSIKHPNSDCKGNIYTSLACLKNINERLVNIIKITYVEHYIRSLHTVSKVN
jgi:hypothetical protein